MKTFSHCLRFASPGGSAGSSSVRPRLPVLWAVLLAAFLANAAPVSARPPNVVIILTDDQGTLDARCFGSPDLRTPGMNRLAREGVRFTQAYAHTACCPARAALLTGRHPQRSDINSWTQGHRDEKPAGRNMALEAVTLAEALKPAGYATGLFGKWHLGAHPDRIPTKQGFDEFFGILGGFIDNHNHHYLHGTGAHDLFDGGREIFCPGEYFPDLVQERTLAFIERHRDEPFLLYYPLNLPHYPEQSAKAEADAYPELPEPRRSYARALSTADRCLERILTQLDALKLREHTIVLFQSDNGHDASKFRIKVDNHLSGLPKGTDYGPHDAGNTGKWAGSKGGFLEGGIRTPAILSYPAKLPQNEVRDQAVTIMDWYPTILELCGVPAPRGVPLDGRSVLPVVRDASAPGTHAVLHWQWQESWAVREGDWKLIVNGTHGYGRGRLETPMLANLADESPERKNHASEHPEIIARLQAAHDEWARDVFRVFKP